jgi:hypothetical protein
MTISQFIVLAILGLLFIGVAASSTKKREQRIKKDADYEGFVRGCKKAADISERNERRLQAEIARWQDNYRIISDLELLKAPKAYEYDVIESLVLDWLHGKLGDFELADAVFERYAQRWAKEPLIVECEAVVIGQFSEAQVSTTEDTASIADNHRS